MSNEGRARENGYRAFISYSHRDDAAAKSLHKRLETYRLPKKLIGQSGERGPIPERLTPIFRDLDELSAADDLTVEIKAALARSATLIVLCSPGAKASKWVNLEIETFRALHGNSRPVLAALIEGEPADAFPPALIANGQEPVAADFRKNRDGKSLALLKLVAGMAGAPLDALVQRDAQRQYRRVMAITGTALTAALAMALLLVVALRAQSEAERQRQEAEGLVEYMLTDLRDKLKGVGRISVMTAVNERAMKYYGAQEDLDDLAPESLQRRARILHAMGEDDEKQGNLKLALQKFQEAYRVTNALVTRYPAYADAGLAHARSESWLGYASQQQGNYADAVKRFQNYLTLAKRVSVMMPDSTVGLKEIGLAHNSLGAVYLQGLNDPNQAITHFEEYARSFEKVVLKDANDKNAMFSVSDAFGWIADAHFIAKRYNEAIISRKMQIVKIDELLKNDMSNDYWLLSRISADRAIFRICFRQEDYECASKHIKFALDRISYKSFDYNNLDWLWQAAYVHLDSAYFSKKIGATKKSYEYYRNAQNFSELYSNKQKSNFEKSKELNFALSEFN